MTIRHRETAPRRGKLRRITRISQKRSQRVAERSGFQADVKLRPTWKGWQEKWKKSLITYSTLVLLLRKRVREYPLTWDQGWGKVPHFRNKDLWNKATFEMEL